MQPTIPNFVAWQGFYTTLGESSATLVGLLFVGASVGSSVFTEERHYGLRIFLSPTVVHFSSILLSSLVLAAPHRSVWVAGLPFVIEAVLGLAYSALVLHRMFHHGVMEKIDWEDRIWYAALPALAYAAILGAGAALMRGDADSCGYAALALCALLTIGLRNAWDITTWAVLKRKT